MRDFQNIEGVRETVKGRGKGIVAAGMAAAVVLGVAGCGSSTSNQTSSHPVSKSTSGGVIEYAVQPATDLNWFLPLFTGPTDTLANAQLVYQMFVPLLQLNNSYQIDWKNSIADKVTYNSSGTVYHIYLNPKWKWSNGQPVTSTDLLFTWNVMKAACASNAPSPWPYVGVGTGDIPNGIKSVVANGPYEVTVTLNQPTNQQWFIYNGLMQMTPMPAKYMDVKQNMTDELKYLGSNGPNMMFDKVVDGPFEPVYAKDRQEWVLKPNPMYAGHKSTLSKLIFLYEGSNESELAALRSGQVNVGYLDPSESAAIPQLKSSGFTIAPEYMFAVFWTEMNMYPASPNSKIFNQLYVRQALMQAINNDEIAQQIYKGYAVPLHGPIPSQPNTQFYDPAVAKLYPYNPSAAKKLLEDHGWRLENGVMTNGNQKMNFTMIYATGVETTVQEAELIQQELAQIGVKVSLKGMPFDQLISLTSNPKDTNWDLALGSGWIYSGPGYYPSGDGLFNTGAPSGTGYSNSTEDALINATHQPYSSTAETMKHFYQYEYYTAEQLPMLWNVNNATVAVIAPNVQNVLPYYNGAVGIPEMQYWTVSGQ
ncbi:MAG: peptide ABC transporter substrate-binding protein [Alicyclobacillus mali]|nr:peptide ABC transporter substrate-binding protein [Alicyclobacillus mali (ex Roth et al. 2021)]